MVYIFDFALRLKTRPALIIAWFVGFERNSQKLTNLLSGRNFKPEFSSKTYGSGNKLSITLD